MKVAVYYSSHDIRIEEKPVPSISKEEILVEMKSCGLCGSDLMDWYLKAKAPLVLGHEPTGTVAQVGDKVEGFKEGERVFVHHHVACLTCHYCIHGDYTMCETFTKTHIFPGGFAEYFKVPAPNLKIDTFKIPNQVSFDEATLIEPVACCIRALRKCRIEPGDTVAVIGAGPAGIIHTILAKHFGASQVLVSDFVDYRLEAAKEAGADLAVNPEKAKFEKTVKEATGGRGADLVIVTAPNAKAYMEALKVCRKGGTVSVFAPTSPGERIEVSPNLLFFNEVKIVPSYSTSHVETRMALQLILRKVIDAEKLITHRFPLESATEAFKTAKESKECLKIVIFSE